ncbi:hypothetical protein ACSVHC_03650 [Arthrobacter sp. KNU-44]|uniref:hypothetical protein n=1 Tax=Arthrobacter sp. KNU-44 TaxID=3450744 RepID=UPI003F43ED47
MLWALGPTFRKTVGTLLEASSGVAAASAQLGHSSENVTRKHYVQKTHEAPDNTSLLEAFGN